MVTIIYNHVHGYVYIYVYIFMYKKHLQYIFIYDIHIIYICIMYILKKGKEDIDVINII